MLALSLRSLGPNSASLLAKDVVVASPIDLSRATERSPDPWVCAGQNQRERWKLRPFDPLR